MSIGASHSILENISADELYSLGQQDQTDLLELKHQRLIDRKDLVVEDLGKKGKKKMVNHQISSRLSSGFVAFFQLTEIKSRDISLASNSPRNSGFLVKSPTYDPIKKSDIGQLRSGNVMFKNEGGKAFWVFIPQPPWWRGTCQGHPCWGPMVERRSPDSGPNSTTCVALH